MCQRVCITKLLKSFYPSLHLQLFQRIQNQREILRFLTPILNFLIHFFSLFLALFVHFDCQCEGSGSKKLKIFFYECILEFYQATPKGLHNQVVKIVVPYCGISFFIFVNKIFLGSYQHFLQTLKPTVNVPQISILHPSKGLYFSFSKKK